MYLSSIDIINFPNHFYILVSFQIIHMVIKINLLTGYVVCSCPCKDGKERKRYW